ncbi:hypothetical protein B0F90DRAFT_1815930 [Multifurca ochricompacta]|uniref:Wax synthase domain-containing protein n=1 Tax=Multifurca ochricompacta TaxID=376703 RepID=A0AAD4M678_9AGAM|nr:hypothetical protein B0F90DRAFT_1815930 [Multifurca ochricompacta]
MALRTFEWTFTKKPLRRYDIRKGQNAAVVERPLSRGIGWSWSSKPFPDGDIPPVSIGSVVAKLFLKVAAFDASHHIMSTLSPAINQIGAAICAICGGVWVYAVIDSMYHIATLIGRIILRQPASHWPPNSHRPWLSTSIHEFWSFRWHQFFRHFFITFGARPGGALLGQPGALIGAFTISATIHYLGMWGLGHGTDFIAAGIFFLFMGLGTVFEDAFKKATGVRVQGMLGWLWTMLWVLVWGMVMVDGWAQRGMFSADFLPEHLRPGKLLVDAISIRLSK